MWTPAIIYTLESFQGQKQDLWIFKPVYFTAGQGKIKICYAVVKPNIRGLYFMDGNKMANLKGLGLCFCYGCFVVLFGFPPSSPCFI